MIPVHTGYMDRTITADVESIRARVRAQLKVNPDPTTWDEPSKDRLWLLGELTRQLRLGRTVPQLPANGHTPKHRVEYSGDTCTFCGSLNMRRAGSCSVCENCGETGGCS